MDQDIRWRQRLDSYRRSVVNLQLVYDHAGGRPLDIIERQALIKAFELCYETGWILMKDWFEYQGITGLSGSRDAVRTAFTQGLLADGESWMDMIRNRNRTSHVYNEGVAKEVEALITSRYKPAFAHFLEVMESRARTEEQ